MLRTGGGGGEIAVGVRVGGGEALQEATEVVDGEEGRDGGLVAVGVAGGGLRAAPDGKVGTGQAAGHGELAADDELVVIDGQGADDVVGALAQGHPLLAIPGGDAVGGLLGGLGEVAPGDEQFGMRAGAVGVEGGEGMDGAIVPFVPAPRGCQAVPS
jgi:hypothetical protein